MSALRQAVIEQQSNVYPSREAWLRQFAYLKKKGGVKFDRCIDHPARSSVDAYSYSAMVNRFHSVMLLTQFLSYTARTKNTCARTTLVPTTVPSPTLARIRKK